MVKMPVRVMIYCPNRVLMPQAAFAGFLLWEGVKILLAVAMLWLAPKIVPELSWLGLLAGLVLTLKVYWFGFWTQTRRSNVNG